MWSTIGFVSALIKCLMMLLFVMNVAALLTWLDRRGGAMIQDRVGPNRAMIKIGKVELRLAGLLHAAADGVKFFFKEDFMPPKADKLLFSLAPILSMAPVFCLVAVIPFGDTLCYGPGLFTAAPGQSIAFVGPAAGFATATCAAGMTPISLAVTPLNVGLLYIFAISGQGIIGAAIAGWSSDNKFSLMGALRAASQMVSYEVAIGLSIVGCLMTYGTVNLTDAVRWQADNAWGMFVQPLGFLLFFVASIAENKRIPFDLPEAESELVSGYFTEYSGMKFGMFYLGEYAEVVTSSMILVTLFLGGWHIPFMHANGPQIHVGTWMLETQSWYHWAVVLTGSLAFFGKTLLVCWFQHIVRWSLPRFRYDQLMRLGWTILLPLSLGNIVVTGGILLFIKSLSPESAAIVHSFADLSQAFIAVLGIVTLFSFGWWIGGSRTKLRAVIGTPADFAHRKGGTPNGPMQA